MGKRNYLIDGVSGSGKTTVATELQRRGYQAIHGDRELVYRGDPKTGLPMVPPQKRPTAIWMSEHHLWDLEKVTSYITSKNYPVTFFCGGSRNYSQFVDSLDGVFILEVDMNTMIRRIDERVSLDPTDFGGKPEERDLILQLHATKKDIPTSGIVIDANQPVVNVVDTILSYVHV